MENFDAFNFDAMKEAVGIDPFAQEANKYGKDERFYTLSKDKDGNTALSLARRTHNKDIEEMLLQAGGT